MRQEDLRTRKREKGWLSIEVITLIYMAITTVMTLVWWDGISHPMGMIWLRIGVLAVMGLMQLLYHFYPSRITITLRFAPLLLCLIQWYPETYEFCKQFNYQDHVFASWDWTLFHCQPSLLFSEWMNSTFIYEAFHLGYYSYYYMMMATILFYLVARYKDFQWATWVFLASFFLFYFIFEFLPSAGPQFYYAALGTEAASKPFFPELGHYFVDHQEALPIDVRGPFSRLVLSAQETGERPTAAFPSSHVGMSTVTMYLAWKTRNRWLFYIQLPLYILLVLSTVYVKAHYVVDSIAGFFVAVLFIVITNATFKKAQLLFKLKK